MTQGFLRRFVAGLCILWAVASLTFFLASLAPGDIATQLADPRLSPAARARLRQYYGLDRPLLQRYSSWLQATLQGDFGDSFLYRRPVTQVLSESLPHTALLAGVGIALEFALGISLGLIQARRPHGLLDRTLTSLSLTAYALPSFLLAALLLWLFAYTLPVFPPSHMTGTLPPAASPWLRLQDRLAHLALPAMTIGLTSCGAVARYLRGTLLEQNQQTYILAALARGASSQRVLFVHALPNALLPLITLVGLSLPFLVSGSLLVEVIFSWPGIGKVFYSAVTARDIPLIQASTLLVTAAVILGNWLADVTYSLADPRVRT